MKAIRIIVEGDVQGVFFRKYTEEKAGELGIKGTVENLDDGSVEIYAEGDDDVNLKKFISWCYEGSPKATVDNVITEDIAPSNHTSFKQKK